MSHRTGAVRRRRTLCWLASLVVVLLLFSEGAARHYGPPRPQLPAPERWTGVNLFWHLPGSYWDDSCNRLENCNQDVLNYAFGPLPTWYVDAQLQALKRDNLRAFDFASLGEMGPGVLSSSGFNDAFAAGARVTIGRSLGDWYRIEGSFWGGYDWSNDGAVRNNDANAQGGTGNLFSPLTGFGDPAVPGLDFNNLVTVHQSAQLDSVELNLRRRMSVPYGPVEASFLVGVRYLRIDEGLNYHSEANVPLPGGAINDVFLTTDNDMTGAQLGVQTQWLLCERSWLDVDVKGAIFSNSASLHSRYTNTDENGAVTQFVDSDQRTSTSYLLETSLLVNYQFTPALTFRVGYTALWMSGLTLASDNLSSNAQRLTLGPVLVDDHGRIAWHGPTIGLVGAW